MELKKKYDVLIGVPTCLAKKYCLDEFISGLKKVKADVLFVVSGEEAYATLIRSKGYPAIMCENGEGKFQSILNARKTIRKTFLDKGYDYLFFVDSDVILEDDTLEKLKKENKDVITGAYLNSFNLGREKVIAPVVFKDVPGGAQLYTYEGMFPERVEEIGAAGLGCALIKKEVLEKIDFRLMDSGKSEDIAFYLDARKNGFKAYVNTDVKCTHRCLPKDNESSWLYEWRTTIRSNTISIDSKN